MSSPAAVVRNTSSEMAHTAVCLPGPLISVISAFNKIHRLWRWFRLGKIYSNPNNFLKLAAGHGLNAAFGNNVILRISAICVLIATRILECVEQHFSVQRAFNDLVSAFRGRFPTPIKVIWCKNSAKKFFSGSTVAWWKYHAKKIWEVIKRVALCLLKLVKEAFILSMRIADAVQSFTLSPTIRNEGINLLFVNGSLWMDRLVENKDMLIQGLTANRKVIEKVLKGIGSPFKVHQLINVAKGALDKAEKMHLAMEKVSRSVGTFLTACLKKWGFEFMHGLGLHSLIPRSLLPSSTPPWVTPPHKRIRERYPPQKFLTRPSMLFANKTKPAQRSRTRKSRQVKVILAPQDTSHERLVLTQKEKAKQKSVN